MADIDEWPPPIGATVRGGAGFTYLVASRKTRSDVGLYIVIRRSVPGGWQARPVTESQWVAGAFHVVRASPDVGR
jgi:hypothetical protein